MNGQPFSRRFAVDGIEPKAKAKRNAKPATPKETTSLVAKSDEEIDASGIEETFKAAFTKHAESRTTLTKIVLVAVQENDIERDTLIEWAVECGYAENYCRATINAILKADGKFKGNSKGQGRKASPEAIALFEYALGKYGEGAAALLLAASRYGTKQAKASKAAK